MCPWRVQLERVKKCTCFLYVSSGTELVSIAATTSICTVHHPWLDIASTQEKQVLESLRQSIANHGSESFPLEKNLVLSDIVGFVGLFLYKMRISYPASLNIVDVFLGVVSRHPGASWASHFLVFSLCLKLSPQVPVFSPVFSVQTYSGAHFCMWN